MPKTESLLLDDNLAKTIEYASATTTNPTKPRSSTLPLARQTDRADIHYGGTDRRTDA